MNKDFSTEQQGLVAVTILGFEEKSSEMLQETYLQLQLSDGGFISLFRDQSRLRLIRQADRHLPEGYLESTLAIELVVHFLIKRAAPIIVKRVARNSELNKKLWSYSLPPDTELL